MIVFVMHTLFWLVAMPFMLGGYYISDTICRWYNIHLDRKQGDRVAGAIAILLFILLEMLVYFCDQYFTLINHNCQ